MKTPSEWRMIPMQTAFRPKMTYPTDETEWGAYIEKWIGEAQKDAIEAAAKLVEQKGCGSSFCLYAGAVRALVKERP